jgi:hypothetical protein
MWKEAAAGARLEQTRQLAEYPPRLLRRAAGRVGGHAEGAGDLRAGTVETNLGPGCRRHHRLKHESGATVWQLDPGDAVVWTTRSGMQYLTNPTRG